MGLGNGGPPITKRTAPRLGQETRSGQSPHNHSHARAGRVEAPTFPATAPRSTPRRGCAMTDGDHMPWRKYSHVDPRRPVTHLAAVIGRRGTALLLIGCIWAGIGASTLTLSELDGLAVTIGVAWIITGTVAIMSAKRRQGHDALGFLALYVMAAFRALTHLSDVVVWIVPDGRAGDPSSIVAVLVWVAVTALIVLVSGWKEPEPDHPQATP